MKKTNKIISIILTVFMLMSTLPVMFAQAAAPEAEYEIEFGKDLTVTTGSEGVYVKFAPKKSCRYIFRSESESGEVDTGAWMVDANGDEIASGYMDDTAASYDFELESEFEAGEEYYLYVYVYSENSETFKITIECGHSYENGTCTVCGDVCDHTEIGFLGFCICGEKFLSKAINNGDETEVEFKSAGEEFWFVFVPVTSGTYSFKSISDTCDPDCYLYGKYGTILDDSYDVDGCDFNLVYYFEAGEIYYLRVYNCYDADTVELELTLMSHTAADNSEHNLEYVESSYSDCTNHGYTEGFYCAICDIYVSGHEELPLDKDWHTDDDWDDVCDLCGDALEYDDSDDSAESEDSDGISFICDILTNLSVDGIFGRLIALLHNLLHTLMSFLG